MRLRIWGGFSLLVFLFLVVLETQGYFLAFDPKVTIFLQTLVARSFDTLLSFFSLLGNAEPSTIFLGVIGLWVYKKEKRLFFPLVLFFVALTAVELFGKFFLYHPGPPPEFFRFNLPFELPHVYVKTNYAFPSGHVGRTAYLAVAAVFFSQRFLTNLFIKRLFIGGGLVYLAVMMVSRVYLGEHWLSDVLGGMFLGVGTGLLAIASYDQRR